MRRRATKHVPRVSPYSPASIDPGFVEIGHVQLSQSVLVEVHEARCGLVLAAGRVRSKKYEEIKTKKTKKIREVFGNFSDIKVPNWWTVPV